MRQAHELPPAPARATRHHGGRPARVADLQVDRVEHPRLVQNDVDDEPVVEEAEVLHGHLAQLPDRAVGAVAADDIAGSQRLAGGGLDRNALLVLCQAGDLHAAAHMDAHASGLLVEEGFQGGLVEHQRLGPTRQAHSVAAQAQQRETVTVAPLVEVSRFADPGQVLAQTARLDDTGHLVIHMHGPGQRIGAGLPFEHDHRPALLGQQDGQRGPDRPVADNGDVGVEFHVGHGVRRDWCPQRLMRS